MNVNEILAFFASIGVLTVLYFALRLIKTLISPPDWRGYCEKYDAHDPWGGA